MADKKISQLTAAATPLAGTEVLPIVQSGATVKVAVSDLTAGRDVSTKNLTSTGDVSLNGGTFVFNDSGADLDARFEGDTDPNLLYTDAGNDRVGVGTATPLEKFHASGTATFGVSSLAAPNRYTAFNTLNKATIAASGTAVIDIVANNISGTGFSAAVAEVDLIVAWASSPQTLQGHYKYSWITVDNSTNGGTATIIEMYNGSAGAFTVATTDFVVSRPSARTIRITYTSTALGDVSLSCLVKGWSISSVSIT
jgi:hypothetical protein